MGTVLDFGESMVSLSCRVCNSEKRCTLWFGDISLGASEGVEVVEPKAASKIISDVAEMRGVFFFRVRQLHP